MGTSNVSIFYKSLVLKEPNVALIRRKNGVEPIAFGNEALNLVGSADEYCSFINPVSDGVIVNAEVAGFILSHYLKKVLRGNPLRTVEIIAVIPCGLSVAERENIENAFYRAGYKEVALIESVLGLLPFVDGKGSAVMVIGGGTTEFAVLKDGAILSACSLNIGGKEVDKRIKEKVLDIYNIVISEYAAERLKKEIGSLYDNNTASYEIAGRGVLDQALHREEITAESIKAPISFCYKKIIDVAESLFTTLPSSAVSEVISRGLYLAGGGAAMQGLEDFINKYLHISATIDAEPETTVLRGINELIESGKLHHILNFKK